MMRNAVLVWIGIAASLVLLPSQASADKGKKEVRSVHFQKLEILHIFNRATPVKFELTISSDGTYTKSFNVEQYPCAKVKPNDPENKCVGAFVMGLREKKKDGNKWIHFKAHGKMTPRGFKETKFDKNEFLAKNYDDFVDGKFEVKARIDVVKRRNPKGGDDDSDDNGGNFFDDLISGVGKALAVVGPALLAL